MLKNPIKIGEASLAAPFGGIGIDIQPLAASSGIGSGNSFPLIQGEYAGVVEIKIPSLYERSVTPSHEGLTTEDIVQELLAEGVSTQDIILPGSARNIVIGEHFDEPLDEFADYM